MAEVHVNGDFVRSMTDGQLAEFLTKIADDAWGPWEEPFHTAFCQECRPVEHIDEEGFEDSVWPCWRGGPGCPHAGSPALWWLGQPTEGVSGKPQTVGDRFRAVTDEELAEFLFRAYRRTVDEVEFSDLSMKWCDGKSGCVDERGEIECTEEMHRACILRWVKKEAEPNDPGILGFV